MSPFPFHPTPPQAPTGDTPPPLPFQQPPPFPQSGPPAIQRHTGRFFRFALPAGWNVQENSNLICITSPDQRAAIMTVGLAGLMQPFTPDQFVQYALQMQSMQLTGFINGRQVPPAPGCSSAGQFELTYTTNGIPCHGIAVCNVAVGYGQCNASMTIAAARVEAWPEFRAWLPQVAAEVTPAGSQTYMAGQIASNNLQNSIQLGEHFRAVNDYTQAQWQQVTNERWASDERRNFEFRENLGAIQTFTNPYDNHRLVELSTQYRFYWVNRKGEIAGSDDPGFDPRTGSTEEWTPMPRYR